MRPARGSGPARLGRRHGGRRRGAVRWLPAPVTDDLRRLRRRVPGAAGVGPAARQPAAARLVGYRRLVLHDRAAAVRPHRVGPRPERGRHTRGGRDDLHAARAGGGVPRPGHGEGRGRAGPGTARGGDHARTAARAGYADPRPVTRPRRHQRPDPADLAARRPRLHRPPSGRDRPDWIRPDWIRPGRDRPGQPPSSGGCPLVRSRPGLVRPDRHGARRRDDHLRRGHPAGPGRHACGGRRAAPRLARPAGRPLAGGVARRRGIAGRPGRARSGRAAAGQRRLAGQRPAHGAGRPRAPGGQRPPGGRGGARTVRRGRCRRATGFRRCPGRRPPGRRRASRRRRRPGRPRAVAARPAHRAGAAGRDRHRPGRVPGRACRR